MKKITLIGLVAVALFLSGCQKKEQISSDTNGTPITTIKATKSTVQYLEKSVGSIDAKSAPMINGEVNGQITKVLCEVGDRVSAGQVLATIDASQYQNTSDMNSANVKNLESQLANQKKTVARYEELLKQNFISEAKLDELRTAQRSYEEQLAGAKAGYKESQRANGKSVVRSPIDGVVYARNVSVGDFASVGKPLFGVVNSQNLVIKAPFPESIGNKIKKGQKVYLYTSDESHKVDGVVSDIRPFVSANGRSFEAIISLKNENNWLVGGSINVEVVSDEHKDSFVVPENAVVLRPAGDVVYVVSGDSVKQKKVKAGQKQNGNIEIIEGIDGSENIANDGAGLLTDGAKINITIKK